MPAKSAGTQNILKWMRKNKCSDKAIYLDSNSTTLMCKESLEIMDKWAKCFNPASTSKVSHPARELIDKAKLYILKHCGVSDKQYTCIFTSGGTESNCTILRSAVDSYSRITGKKPHIITSAIEHHSIIDCIQKMQAGDQVEVTFVQPNIYGSILPKYVEGAIKPNTCLISIMYANNETGTINNIKSIGEVAHKHKIPLHSDAVQAFGKFQINLRKEKIDALSVSFHKFYGPKGIGLLILNNDLIKGYELHGIINGSQQNGLRGGTENPMLVAAGTAALVHAFNDRKQKNHHVFMLKQHILKELAKEYPVFSLPEYQKLPDARSSKSLPVCFVILGMDSQRFKFCLPNTLLLSVAVKGKKICNMQLKKDLDKDNVVVSISSACLADSKQASHVIISLGVSDVVKRGVIRISIPDSMTKEKINKFIKSLKKNIAKQL